MVIWYSDFFYVLSVSVIDNNVNDKCSHLIDKVLVIRYNGAMLTVSYKRKIWLVNIIKGGFFMGRKTHIVRQRIMAYLMTFAIMMTTCFAGVKMVAHASPDIHTIEIDESVVSGEDDKIAIIGEDEAKITFHESFSADTATSPATLSDLNICNMFFEISDVKESYHVASVYIKDKSDDSLFQSIGVNYDGAGTYSGEIFLDNTFPEDILLRVVLEADTETHGLTVKTPSSGGEYSTVDMATDDTYAIGSEGEISATLYEETWDQQGDPLKPVTHDSITLTTGRYCLRFSESMTHHIDSVMGFDENKMQNLLFNASYNEDGLLEVYFNVDSKMSSNLCLYIDTKKNLDTTSHQIVFMNRGDTVQESPINPGEYYYFRGFDDGSESELYKVYITPLGNSAGVGIINDSMIKTKSMNNGEYQLHVTTRVGTMIDFIDLGGKRIYVTEEDIFTAPTMSVGGTYVMSIRLTSSDCTQLPIRVETKNLTTTHNLLFNNMNNSSDTAGDIMFNDGESGPVKAATVAVKTDATSLNNQYTYNSNIGCYAVANATNQSYTVIITPEEGYDVGDMFINGTPFGETFSEFYDEASKSYLVPLELTMYDDKDINIGFNVSPDGGNPPQPQEENLKVSIGGTVVIDENNPGNIQDYNPVKYETYDAIPDDGVVEAGIECSVDHFASGEDRKVYNITIHDDVVLPSVSISGNGSVNFLLEDDAMIVADEDGYSIYQTGGANVSIRGVGHTTTCSLYTQGGVILSNGTQLGDGLSLNIGSSMLRSEHGLEMYTSEQRSPIHFECSEVIIYSNDTALKSLTENNFDVYVDDGCKVEFNTAANKPTVSGVDGIYVSCGGQVTVKNPLDNSKVGLNYGSDSNPDTFQLFSKYWPFDENLGNGVVATDLNDGSTHMEYKMDDCEVESPGVYVCEASRYKMTNTNDGFVFTSTAPNMSTFSFNMPNVEQIPEVDLDGDNIVDDTEVNHGKLVIVAGNGVKRGDSDYRVEVGSDIYIKLVPDYGYQYVKGSLKVNGDSDALTVLDNVACYKFTMAGNNIHIGAEFEPKPDTIDTASSTAVSGATIELGDADKQAVMGNLKFTVEDTTPEANVVNAISNKLGEYEVGSYLDLGLSEIVAKNGAANDVWTVPVSELDEDMTVSLALDESLQNKNNYKVIRDHNGTIDVLDATYNSTTNKLTFATDRYSTYAIAYTESEEVPSVDYVTHIQDIGWEKDVKCDGERSGSTGKSKRLEAIKVAIDGYAGLDLGVRYKTHIQDIGWTNWSADSALSGTEGKSKRLEAIAIELTGADKDKYDIYYQVHAQNYGWLDWAANGDYAGTTGQSLRIEAIKIKLVAKGDSAPGKTGCSYIGLAENGSISSANSAKTSVVYNTHVENIGDQASVCDGSLSGTTGKGLRLEAITVSLKNQLYSGSIEYRTHIQDIGWESAYVSNGAISGTKAQSKRLEAIEIRLTGDMADHYDVYYRVYSQDYGWLSWTKNGAPAGTEGLSKRLESIQIVLVEKGQEAPTETSGNPAFIK